MSVRQFYDADGEFVRWEHNDLTGDVIIKRLKNINPLLEENKTLQNHTTGWNGDKSMRKVASLDPIVVQEWCRQDGISFGEFMRNKRHYSKWLRRKLYSNENRMFLSAPHKSTIGGI